MNRVTDILNAEKARFDEKLKAWLANQDACLPIIEAMNVIGEFDVDWANSLDFRFTGDKHKLAGAVRVLRTRGWTSSKEPPIPGETWVGIFHKENAGFQVWLIYTSSVCRKVKIGTKMVEQDVFEVVCDEVML